MVSGCASIPDVPPPSFAEAGDANAPDAPESAWAGVRRFDGTTVEQVLSAAEAVLRDHLPGANFSRSGSSLSAEYRDRAFYGFAGGERAEKWLVAARESAGSTIASVTSAGVHASVVAFLGAATHRWPIADSMLVPHEVRASDATFWHRVERAIAGEGWPECDKPSLEFKFQTGGEKSPVRDFRSDMPQARAGLRE